MDISPHGLSFILRLETGEEAALRTTTGEDEQRRKKIKHHAAAVSKRLRVPLNQKQFDAMVSFAVSAGLNAFQETNVLARLNARDYTGAAEALLLWVYAGGLGLLHLGIHMLHEP